MYKLLTTAIKCQILKSKTCFFVKRIRGGGVKMNYFNIRQNLHLIIQGTCTSEESIRNSCLFVEK